MNGCFPLRNTKSRALAASFRERLVQRYVGFLGFAPAEDPQILGLCIIHDPKGIYYGGTVAAPVIRGIFENILPYLGIEKSDVSDFSAEGN